MRRESRIQLAIVGLVVAIGLVWPSVAAFYTDWLWFERTGLLAGVRHDQPDDEARALGVTVAL